MEDIQQALWHDSKKFMWDGEIYEDKTKAEEVEKSYRGNGFETQIRPAEGKYLVYSRRVAQAAVEGG
jgi:hypothetical protein